MNREIKFRVWNGETFEIEPRLKISLLNCEPYKCYVAGFGNEIQFFAGLKDKNNKEIYEGDIVKCSYYIYSHEIESYIGEVFFDKGIFYFGKDMKFAANDNNFLLNEIEIIGNIFENPELLK